MEQVEILERLSQAFSLSERGGIARLSKKSNVHHQTIRSWFDKGLLPSFSALSDIHNATGLSIDWLLTGKGPMYTRERVGPVIDIRFGERDISGGFGVVPLMQGAAALGAGTVVQDYVDEEDPVAIVPASWARPGVSAVRVDGDSMAPIINPGDIVGIDRQPLTRRGVHGRLVAARVDEGVTIKRAEVAENGLVLRAENPAYPAFIVAAPDVEGAIIGVVVWWWHEEK